MFEGSILTYNPATNGAEWISVRGTVNDLSPAEDASTQELSNITIPDSSEDAPQIDHFEEHWQESITEAPVKGFHTDIDPHEGEEVMEQVPPDGENLSRDSSEESDSDGGISRCHCSDSVSQAEEEGEDRQELAREPTEELTGDPVEGPTEELTLGHPSLV